ncbi:hypothetical protein [Streptomyces sp. NPDC056817]|uniref:hypothetical protein n=1 Tax=Streptomyces sp. NPDC056817 TaxID=3345950 RepID=UPI0036C1504C
MTLGPADPHPLHVDSAAITQHITWDIARTAAREAALTRARGQATTQRLTLPYAGGWMRLMAAEVSALGIFGYKEFHLASDNSVRYCVHVFDTASGRPLGMVDAAWVTTLRTAATAAVAIGHLMDTDAPTRLAVVGSGAEALAGVAALHGVLTLDDVRVTSRRETNRAGFVRQVARRTGLTATGHAEPATALDGADLVYAATNSGGQVVLRGADVTHIPVIASIGSTLPNQRELGGEILAGAARVLVDTPDVLHESGDALEARDAGLTPERVELLGTALQQERGEVEAMTVYKSIGSPEQDLVLAAAILDAAATCGFGRRIAPLSAPKVNL